MSEAKPDEPRPFDVLLVESDPGQGQTTFRQLSDSELTVEWVRNGHDGLNLLYHRDFSFLLLNEVLPDMSAFAFLERAKQGRNIPFVVMSDARNDQIAEEVFRRGALDYVQKSATSLERLKHTLKDFMQQSNKFNYAPQSYFELVENAGDAIYFHDISGRLIFLNRKAEELTGYRRFELINQHVRVILHGDGEKVIRNELRKKRSDRWKNKFELHVRAKNGEIIPVELSMTPILKSKKLVGFEGIARDIREKIVARKMLDEQEAKINELNVEIQKTNMKLEESSRIQSEFVSNISHEFRTPLNGIMGYVELLQDEVYGSLNKSQTDALDNIKSCATDLLEMVQQLLDLSKIKSNQLTLDYEPCLPHDLIQATAGTIRPIARAKGLNLVITTMPDQQPIRVDFRRLYQVFVNLAGNSVKFTKKGEIEIGAHREQGNVRYYVRDTGIGVSPEMQELIFQEFRQGDSSASRLYGGMGLGLSLSKRLVELHGGEIGFKSNPGGGSTFFFTIPLIASPEADGNP